MGLCVNVFSDGPDNAFPSTPPVDCFVSREYCIVPQQKLDHGAAIQFQVSKFGRDGKPRSYREETDRTQRAVSSSTSAPFIFSLSEILNKFGWQTSQRRILWGSF